MSSKTGSPKTNSNVDFEYDKRVVLFSNCSFYLKMEKEENWTGKRICKGGVNNKFFIVQEPLREEVHHFKRVRYNLSFGPLLRDGFL